MDVREVPLMWIKFRLDGQVSFTSDMEGIVQPYEMSLSEEFFAPSVESGTSAATKLLVAWEERFRLQRTVSIRATLYVVSPVWQEERSTRNAPRDV